MSSFRTFGIGSSCRHPPPDTALTLPQLKILQEATSLLVFVPFSVLYMRAPIGLDYLWAALCICGAVFFIFRSSWLGVSGV